MTARRCPTDPARRNVVAGGRPDPASRAPAPTSNCADREFSWFPFGDDLRLSRRAYRGSRRPFQWTRVKALIRGQLRRRVPAAFRVIAEELLLRQRGREVGIEECSRDCFLKQCTTEAVQLVHDR